jgi:hypothetical protein
VTGRAGLQNRHPLWSYTGRGRIRFLGSDRHDCSIRFIKLFITAYLPLRRSRAEPRRIYRELRQTACGLQESIAVEKVTYVLNSQGMSYILNMLICIDMILLDNLLHYFLFIVVIGLSSTFYSTAVLICILLILFMFYLCIKIKLKLLIFSTDSPTSHGSTS